MVTAKSTLYQEVSPPKKAGKSSKQKAQVESRSLSELETKRKALDDKISHLNYYDLLKTMTDQHNINVVTSNDQVAEGDMKQLLGKRKV